MNLVKLFLVTLILSTCSVVASKSSAQEWDFERDIDPISDSENVAAILVASNSEYLDSEYLVVRCLQQNLEAYIAWSYIEAFDPELAYFGIEVITRLDQQDPVTDVWEPSSDLSSTFSQRPEAFIRGLASHDQLVARATTTTAGIVTLIFDLTQAGPVVEEVLEVCGYD